LIPLVLVGDVVTFVTVFQGVVDDVVVVAQ
jgi:hypothetical protein